VYTLRKLSPERSVGLILIPFVALVGAALAGVIFGPPGAYSFLAAVFFLYSAYTFLTFGRTHNTGFIVVGLFQVSGGLVAALRLPTMTRSQGFGLPGLLIACAILLLAWTVVLAVTKRIKWRGREVLELAAASVEQTQNGYTGRPLPVGKTGFTKEQLLGFTEFARRNLIAATYVGRDRVAFVPVRQGKEPPFVLGLKADYAAETWVSFDFSGNVSANVSQRDYLDYREALSFDKLCHSLGDLFVDFVAMFARGEGPRIIGRLDAVGLSMFE
jgi:phosphate starvation-inducible membrane PsiE